MAYCTVADVKQNHERIPTDLAAADQAVEDAAITEFIADADSIIDLYIRNVVSLPFATVPQIIKFLSKTLATCYYLRRIFGAQVEEYHDFIKTYCEMPMELLGEIRDGNAELEEDIAQPDTVKSNTQGMEKIFDLGDVYSQAMHPTDADERYGEST